MHVRVRPRYAGQDLRGWGPLGCCPCTTACANEAAQAAAKQKQSPWASDRHPPGTLLTCSLLLAGVLEAPSCLMAAGDSALSASSALSADSACSRPLLG